MFSSCEGDRGECQECRSVVIVQFTCQYAAYKYMTVLINNNSIIGVWLKAGRH